MPCEGCNIQFTVFKRKRNCTECRRYYCNQCLTKRNNLALCERCLVFTKRPLYKTDLKNVKSKDLIFYLQSKHISTTGCVEKDELVNLILLHVNSVSSNSSNNSNNSSRHNSNTTDFSSKRDSSANNDHDHSNPFIQLKQSCQNFFSNVTDKITSDLNNFTDTTTAKTSTTTTRQHPEHNNVNGPRVITRELPTYSNHLPQWANNPDDGRPQQQQHQSTDHNRPTIKNTNPTIVGNPSVPNHENHFNNIGNNPSNTSSSSSPILSLSSISSQSISSQQQQQSHNLPTLNEQQPATSSKPNHSAAATAVKPNKHHHGSAETQNRQQQKCTAANHRKVFENVFNTIHDGTNSSCGGSTSSGCECSDDEIITKFQKRHHDKFKEKLTSPTPVSIESNNEIQSAGPSNNSSQIYPTLSTFSNSTILQNDCDYNNSSGSSFEELGAVGGNLIKSKNVGATTSNNARRSPTLSDTENWQIIDGNNEYSQNNNENSKTNENDAKNETLHSETTSSVTSLVKFDENPRFQNSSNRQRRILRRRSDGFIYSVNRPTGYEALDFGIASGSGNISRVEEEQSDEDNDDDHHQIGDNNNGGAGLSSSSIRRKRLKSSSCTKCGKTKNNLKRHVAKFKKHLESTHMSEVEIKNELKAFLEYLECRARSFECSDDSAESTNPAELMTEIDFDDERFLNDDDGIHVYAHNDDDCDIQYNQSRFDSRFLGLTEFETLQDFEELTVKQLKEILMLNRIDFKGCCEKQELLERVHRLWKNLQESPAVDKLQVDDLCKICMDAPIECVILECGHMATCTSCGKVLSECPICRQYIVRVVRFFRA